MSTKTIKLNGVASWSKVFFENRDKRGFEDAYVPFDGAYTIELTMDKANFDKLAETGAAKASKMRQKEVEKLGETSLKFVRKHADRQSRSDRLEGARALRPRHPAVYLLRIVSRSVPRGGHLLAGRLHRHRLLA